MDEKVGSDSGCPQKNRPVFKRIMQIKDIQYSTLNYPTLLNKHSLQTKKARVCFSRRTSRGNCYTPVVADAFFILREHSRSLMSLTRVSSLWNPSFLKTAVTFVGIHILSLHCCVTKIIMINTRWFYCAFSPRYPICICFSFADLWLHQLEQKPTDAWAFQEKADASMLSLQHLVFRGA